MLNKSAVAFQTATQMLLRPVCEAVPPTKSIIGQDAKGRSLRQLAASEFNSDCLGKQMNATCLAIYQFHAKSMLLIYNQTRLPYFIPVAF